MTEPYSGAGSNRPGRDSCEQPRKCVDCGELFVSAVALRAHRVAAHKTTIYRCSHCGVRVKGYASLQRHRMLEHGSLRRRK